MTMDGGDDGSASVSTTNDATACFRREDAWCVLESSDSTRRYCADHGFRSAVESLRTTGAPSADVARRAMRDPRVSAAMAVLTGGFRLTVTEEDVRAAESVGDLSRPRDVVTMTALDHAAASSSGATPAGARAAGNARFRDGAHERAAACYLRALWAIANDDDDGSSWRDFCVACNDPARRATSTSPPADSRRADDLVSALQSNLAACYLKLGRPSEALSFADAALDRASAGNAEGAAKAHYRRASAREALAKAAKRPASAVAELGKAVDALRDAASSLQSASKDAHDDDDETKQRTATSLRRARTELRRVRRELENARETERADRARRNREEAAATARAEGERLTTTKTTPPTNTTPHARERDLGFWAREWLTREIRTVRVASADGRCVVAVQELARSGSEVHASVVRKRDDASLFYDLRLRATWTGRSTKGEGGSFDGVIVVYNVGQDTRFELGGDKETSYMYELGFHADYHPEDVAPWARQIKEEAADLFPAVAEVVQRWIVALRQRASE